MAHARRKGAKGSGGKSKLGSTLIKSRNKKKANRRTKLADRKQRETGIDSNSNYVDYGGLNGLTSVTELSSLDEFISAARLADRQFATERNNVVVVPDAMIGGNASSLGNASAVNKRDTASITTESLKIPRRPKWNESTTKEELDKMERTAFLEWRRTIAELEERMRNEDQSVVVTPFEKNIEFWRQLWRVMERSDLLCQIVDARNPLMFYSPDLKAYSSELEERMNKKKTTLLVVNKADYLTPALRHQWAEYFDQEGIEFVFFSALEEQEAMDEKERMEELQASGEAGLDGVANEEKVEEKEEEVEEMEESAKTEASPSSASLESEATQEEESSTVPSMNKGEEKTTDDYENRPAEWDEQGLSERSRVLDRHELVAKIDEIAHRIAFINAQNGVSNGALPTSTGQPLHATVGMVGYPNVGKSSVINVLLGVTSSTHTKQRVGVGATPGKTKHFQTLALQESLTLCDCPGLVFPSFVASKAEMVCNGVLPIAQMRNFMSPVTLLCNRIAPSTFENMYKIQLPRSVVNGKRLPYGARELLQLYSTRRGYMRSGHGGPDESRGARDLLKDYVKGTLLYCMSPPTEEQKRSMLLSKTSTGHSKIYAADNAPQAPSLQPRLVVGGHYVDTSKRDGVGSGGFSMDEEFDEADVEQRMLAMEIAMAKAAAVLDPDDMTVVAVNGVARDELAPPENEFDDDFFALEGEELELKQQRVKKAHRSKGRDLRGKHKARRAIDAAYPTPYENSTSRVGGEDMYGLNKSEYGMNAGGGIKKARGKKKPNRKHATAEKL
jgi:large subunit GTPase 1